MIALKRVKTLPATMLAVDREELSGGGPSLRRRADASPLESPCSGDVVEEAGPSLIALFNRVRELWA
jgi:hypothetical protein